jgi:hypothetical protein
MFYSQAIVFPQLTANVYAEWRAMWASLVSCLVGIGLTVGETSGGSIAKVTTSFPET